MTGDLTATKLVATPVGTPEGEVICDSCNKHITDGRQLRADEDTETTVHVYATCVYGTRRWTNCTDCGPLGEGNATEAGEAHATATVAPDPTHNSVMIIDATVTACAPPDSE